VQLDGADLLVAVPDYRMDIEGPHDLAEELCRLYGYDRIPVTMPADTLPPQRGNPSLEAEEQIRDVLAQAGLREAISYRLTTSAHEARLVPAGQPVPEQPYVTIVNPSSADRVVMRRSILASLLQVAAANSRFQQRIALFEIGAIYLPQENELLPEERPQLAILLTGRRELPGWQSATDALLDFYDLKGIVETLCSAIGVEATVVAANPTGWRPGRTAAVQVNGQEIGRFGELHPRVVAQMELTVADDQPVLAAEFDLARLLPLMATRRNFRPVSAYPAVREDLAFVLPAATPAALAEETIRKAAGPLLHHLTLFDQYTGEHLGPDQKSLAWHLVFQSPTETLSDKAVEKVRRRIIGSMEKTLSARLR
jgi:phenylalanyl-tRNA synthetase beta chain